jgi:YVTN family beta-propeller protein
MNSRHGLRLALAAICLAAVAGRARAQFLEAVIPVGDTPTDILWNPISNKVYTANNQSGSVTVIDGASNQVIATVDVADYPILLSYNSVDNKVYCTSAESNMLNVLDGAADTLLRMVSVSGAPTLMVFNATMNKLYILCYDDQKVRVYDGAADTLVADVWLGSVPGTLLWHPLTNRVFCSLHGTDSVLTIDCKTDHITERLAVGRHPYPMCWNPMNDLVYVDSDGGIRVLTANGDSVVDVIAADALSMCFVPYPNKLYAVAYLTQVIDCVTQAVTDSLPFEGNAVVCDTIRGKVYSAATYPGQCFVFDARSDSLLTAVPLGASPQAICWNSNNSRVYVSDAMDDALFVIRDTSVGVSETELATLCPRRASATFISGTYDWAGDRTAELMDLCGRVIAVLRPGSNDLSRLCPGIYITTEEGSSEHAKVVKLR